MPKSIYAVLLLFCLAAPGAQAAPAILVTGDSLSAAYGIPLESGWVALLQKQLSAEGYPHKVVNTSVSGETSAGGLARLTKAIDTYRPQIVIIELGGNDGLRGLPVANLESNLKQMIALSRQSGSQVLLLGMRLPSNYGKAYTEAFHQVYLELGALPDVQLVPFFLADIALNRGMFQDDGVHPTASAQPVLLQTVWPALAPMLQASQAASAGAGHKTGQ